MGKTFVKLIAAFLFIIASLAFVLWFTESKMGILREELNSRKSYDNEIVLINKLFIDIENFYLISNKNSIEHKSYTETRAKLSPANSSIQNNIIELKSYSEHKNYIEIIDSIQILYNELANNTLELLLLHKLASTSFDKPLLSAVDETNQLLKNDTSFVKKKDIISTKELKKIEKEQQRLERQEKKKQKKNPDYIPTIANDFLRPDSSLFIKIDSALSSLSSAIVKEQNINNKRKDELNQKIYEIELAKHFIYQRINTLLSKIRTEEQVQLDVRISNASQYAEDALYWLFVIFIVASIAAVIFFSLILYDLSKSNYFRKKLIIEKNKAEKLANDKENFLNKMSHEIRTPLNAIVGFSQLLHEEKNQEQSLKYAQQIQSSSTHLLNLINETLDFTRIESGFAKPKLEEFDGIATIQNVIEELDILANKKNLTISTQLTPIDHTIVGDKIWLRQILYNVVGNAIKYTEKGTIEVDASWQTSEAEQKLILKIKDKGIGMSEEQVKSLFDVYKKDFLPSISSGSSGLGLAITKKMVELQNGTIVVQSKMNVGTTFTVEIPYTQGQELSKFNIPKQQTITPNLLNKKILLIDDDVPSLMLLEILLKQWKGTTYKATSVEEAIQNLEEQAFDYIISDWNLSNKTANEILAFIAQKEIKTPIIIVSADNKIKENISAFHHLTILTTPKPVSPKVLANLIK